MDFLYDESGSAYSFIYNGTQYYYVKNLQGDVTRIINTSGAVVATYTYDAWGKVTGSGNIVGQYNPIRYRGYYYDTDTGFYYLQSRYYDPIVKRFINADDTSLIGANGDFISYDLYSYCNNNPLVFTDSSGCFPIALGIIATSTLVGGFLGAFSAATTGGNIIESFIEGCSTGALGATCGIFMPTSLGIAIATIGGVAIDFITQMSIQYIRNGKIDITKIDAERIIKTGLQLGLSTSVPVLSNADKSIDAIGTAIIWAEASTIITIADVIGSNLNASKESNFDVSKKSFTSRPEYGPYRNNSVIRD